MTKEKWNTLSPDQRRQAVLKYDTSGSMKDPRWAPLMEKFGGTYDSLTKLGQEVVKEIP